MHLDYIVWSNPFNMCWDETLFDCCASHRSIAHHVHVIVAMEAGAYMAIFLSLKSENLYMFFERSAHSRNNYGECANKLAYPNRLCRSAPQLSFVFVDNAYAYMGCKME